MRHDGRVAIYSAYYDDAGRLNSWSEESVSPDAADVEELRTTLQLMIEALDKPVVDYE